MLKIMKRVVQVLILLLSTTALWSAAGQDRFDLDSLAAATRDSLRYDGPICLDSTLLNKDIFEVMPSRMKGDASDVRINQSVEVRKAMTGRIESSYFKKLQGYRVRIYFSNAQNAREASLAAAQLFQEKHPGHNVYRSFVSPNFKVTVGDFRTRSEALALLNAVKSDFPAAFIVRENIIYNY